MAASLSRPLLPLRSAPCVALAICLGTPPTFSQSVRLDFNANVEPILQQHCTSCHGPSVQSGGLRLDNAEDAFKGGHAGPVITAGDGAGSLLIRVLTRSETEGPSMPFGSARLPTEQVALLTAWINQGAVWPATEPESKDDRTGAEHWAFRRMHRPAVPSVRDDSWVRNPIDNFVAARLDTEGYKPSPEADAHTLLRRLSLDLIGLPPSPTELERHLAGAERYEDAIDRLMASPHYGEAQALHWLDQARFGESDGYQADYIRPFAWRWRHWVIDAYNRNLGFDQFTVEQIAGDLLPDATTDQQVATGFHRNSLHNREGGFPLEMDRVERTVERISSVGTVWLGLTVGCARCHDHKFDAISQKDFYSLYAFLNTATEADIDAPMAGEEPVYRERRPAFEERRAELFGKYKVPELQDYWERNMLASVNDPDSGLEPIWEILWELLMFEVDGGTDAVRAPPASRTPKQHDLLSRYFVLSVVGGYDFGTPKGYEDLDFDELKKAYKALEEEYPRLTQAYTMTERPKARETHILVRGDYRRPGTPVEPAVPTVLPQLGSVAPNRLDLARWLVSEENPLTARVAVNRIWQRYFGTGLVSTPDDFGTRGELPSHPELLDWLAVEFIESGWDIKAIQRLIVTSSTYRQSSTTRPRIDEVDPANRLLARQARLRLTAETIRDATLMAAGLLDRRLGGESIRPYLPEGATDIGFGNFVTWPQSVGADQFRRGLYIFRQRTLPYPQLETFDAPDTLQVVCKRDQSTNPLQALTLLNDPVFVEAAQALAERTLQEAGESTRERIAYAFKLCLSREATPEEVDRLAAFLKQQSAILTSEPSTSSTDASGSPKDAWAAVASVLLNLSEFLTRT